MGIHQMYLNARILLFLIILDSGTDLFSQTLSHQVLVPVAGVSSTGTISYSQTIGETAVEVISSSDYVFTQGFQQPGIKFSKDTPPPGNGVKVYPNPVTDYVNIELFGNEARSFIIEFVNISGTTLISEKLLFNDQYWYNKQFPVKTFSRGLFFIRIISSDGMISRIFKIEKL